MRIDQIMIKEMLNEYQLGIYSVSVRYIEIFILFQNYNDFYLACNINK